MRVLCFIMLGLVASCKEREVPFEHSTSAFLNGTTPSERVKTILPFFEYNGIFGLMLDDAQFVSDSFVKEGSEITIQLGEQDGWMAIDEQTGWVYFYSETRTN